MDYREDVLTGRSSALLAAPVVAGLIAVGWWSGDVPGTIAVGAGVAAVAALAALGVRRTVSITDDALVERVGIGPIGWQRWSVPRSRLAAIHIEQHDDPGQRFARQGHRWSFAPVEPESSWSVVVVTADQSRIPVHRAVEYADEARQLASELVAALGHPPLRVDEDDPH